MSFTPANRNDAVLFRSANGHLFEMTPVGYQFADITCDSDANWLQIWFHAVSEEGSWSTTDPSLLTSELHDLGEWLRQLGRGEPTAPRIGFLEPNLSFECAAEEGERVQLRIHFECEARPGWRVAARAGRRDCWLDLDVERDQCMQAATAIDRQLARWPVRESRTAKD